MYIRRWFPVLFILLVVKCNICRSHKKPNIVIFLADDVGYGDLQATGNPISNTPNIDILYRDGLKLTQFYSSGPVCTPSRAGLLTGRYPVRSGFWNALDTRSVLRLSSPLGLPHNETTIAELVAEQGYKSALVGKWHLGVGRNREFLPRHHGFDHYFGIPVSLDLCGCPTLICFQPDVPCTVDCLDTEVPSPLFLEDEIIEQPVDLFTLIERQTAAARSWVTEFSEGGNPFLLMYWFVQPHVPLFPSPRFCNSTLGGYYTDSIAEMDWQIGDIIKTLKDIGEFDNTLFLFTSDNGPNKDAVFDGGSSGPLRCGKDTTFEGATRVPGVVYWPSRIAPGISREIISHLDIFPTIANLIGSSVDNIQLDGHDISDVIFNNGKSPRSGLMIFNSTYTRPYAYRYHQYKAHSATLAASNSSNTHACDGVIPLTKHDRALLYNLNLDPGEQVNMANDEAMHSILNDLHTARLLEESGLTVGESVWQESDISIQPCCNEGCEPFPMCCQCVSNYTNELFSSSQRVTNASSSRRNYAWLIALVAVVTAILCGVMFLFVSRRLRQNQTEHYINLS
ncbi:arylsulfatase A-like [Antedon mediterranea]|uniref:arylsulfatase A-like n=1 Tax=Antedon mediterranea TaxID=105859 RepID=UPI003AF7652E